MASEKTRSINVRETIYIAVITALVVGIAAFVGGNIYANSLHDQRSAAVKSAVEAASPKAETSQK